MLKVLSCGVLAAAVLAVYAPIAAAITSATGISPADGAIFDDGDNNPQFLLDGAVDSEFVDLEVSTSGLPGQDGTLADDFVVRERSLEGSDAFPGRWTGQVFLPPGHYFWQAYGSRNTPVVETDQPLGPVRQFDVFPDPVMGQLHAEDDIVDLIRALGLSRPRGFEFGPCTQLNATSWQCQVAWSTAKRVYRGRASVQHVVNGYELNTTGQFLGRSWRRACVRRDRDRLGGFKTRGCTSKPAQFSAQI